MPPFFSIMNENIFSISDILNDGLFGSNKSSAIKYSTIFSFWGQIAGKKFLKTTKPYQIKGSKMYVTCENSFVVQEMIMYKKILLDKLKPYCEPLGVNIADIVFDYKNWNSFSKEDIVNDFPNFYSDEELSEVEYNCSDFCDVFMNIDNSSYLTQEQKEKFKNKIIKLQKAKNLRFS